MREQDGSTREDGRVTQGPDYISPSLGQGGLRVLLSGPKAVEK